ncbi:MAG: chorismate mutase [Bacteroidales bacterium]|nr:chorismate mutase [Bacteroidales bacterium]
MSTDIEIAPLSDWIFTDGRPLVIAGPCSAESEEQLLQTAREIVKIPQVQVFRSGLWKPRTRPGEFEGVGETGLKWLQKVKQETGLKLAIEVAKPEHVEKALEYNIDIIWIGARTVVNPFSIQEIAEALTGVNIPVLVKNPINPDLNLWVGAIERIHAAGINKMAAIHRGFHYFEKSPFRNAPMWEIPIELKRIAPSLPIITDPSHICGNTEMIPSISQKALDFEMDGLMIESHIDPKKALTDASQQLTPKALGTLLNDLVIREKSIDTEFYSKFEELRTEIDKLDGELLQILASRLKIIDEIGAFKKENHITILQMKRWVGILEDRMAQGTHLGLKKDFLQSLLALIHEESIQRQSDIFTETKKVKKS